MVSLKTNVMKKYITLFFTSIILNTCLIGQAQKTYVKSFTKKSVNILLDLDGDVEVMEWEEPYVRVHVTVSLDDGSMEVLKSLMLLRRYSLEFALEEGSLILSGASRREEITYRGRQLKERVVYTVFVPRYTKVDLLKTGKALATSHEINNY